MGDLMNLSEVVRDYVDDFRTPSFEPEAAEMLASAARRAETRMSTEGSGSNDAEVAEIATRYVLLRTAQLTGADGTVTAETVSAILDGLCPGFWPFC